MIPGGNPPPGTSVQQSDVEDADMNDFEKTSKYFFWAAGLITVLGGLPIMTFPVRGLQLAFGLTYFEQCPQLSPIIGHWGIMLVGIGALLFLSATNKNSGRPR